MKYLKIMGLCLVAVAALALSVVASASALETKEPELRAKGGGAIVKNKFTGKGTSTEYVLETEKNGSIKVYRAESDRKSQQCQRSRIDGYLYGMHCVRYRKMQ